MQCVISGQSPTDPVISRKSGYLFERRLVEKCILENGLCPVSGEPLSVDDLIPVQSNKAVRPRNVSSASIPGLLATFQNEWDEVMLEVFTLKQHLDTTRQELSQALYQHDAACRVIARLMRERDEARGMLANVGVSTQTSSSSSSNIPTAPPPSSSDGGTSMEVEGTGPNIVESASWNEIVPILSSKAMELSELRKQRPKKGVPPSTRESSTLANLEVASRTTSHKASPVGGVTSMAIDHSNNTILTGGTDKDLHILSANNGKSIYKISNAHSKAISCVDWTKTAASSDGSSMFLSGSIDSTIKLWKPNSNNKKAAAQEVHCYDMHDGPITALMAHPVESLACSFSEDGTFSVLDLERRECSLRVGTINEFKYLCGGVHPDAIMVGGGTDTGCLKVWDLRQKSLAVNLTDHSSKGVTSLDFSNNGYYVGAGDAVGDFHLWDLRKLKCIHKENLNCNAPIKCVSFDDYGHYAAIGGCGDNNTEIQLWHVKDWNKIYTLSNHSKTVNSVKWGSNAQYLVSGGADRVVNVYK
jgi:pre-mRNA-processing factor 19